MNRSILIVDDDARILTSLSGALADGFEIRTAENAESALSVLADRPVSVVLLDLKMPGMDGMELLKLLRRRSPDLDVIMMTAYDDLPTVAEAMREGAVDFLVKPLDLHALRSALERLFEDRDMRRRRRPESGTGAEEADGAGAPGAGEGRADRPQRLVGHDPGMIEIFKLIGRVAATRTNVVIRGESGTGKELVAREIHLSSPYAHEPFVAVNCTALPATLLESELFGHVRGAFTDATADRRGRFAMAGKGTIFLDEIGDTPPEFQAKLLRVLQEHEYYPVGAERPERADARVIAATHRNLEQLVAAGSFREDLYYRLRVVDIRVPPLRERLGDVPALADHLVRKACKAAGKLAVVVTPESIERLMGYSWPGNVRELENCLTRAVVMATGDVLRPEHLELGGQPTGAVPRMTTLDDVEREHVARVLDAMGGHKSRTAEILGISRPRLDRLIRKYGLDEVVG
jgi:DNA-binding NtrC family response regulator